MKHRSYMFALAAVSLLTIGQSTNVFAQSQGGRSGGVAGGGGHPVEARFKNRILLVADQLMALLPEAKKELKFDPGAFKAAAQEAIPQCLPEDYQSDPELKRAFDVRRKRAFVKSNFLGTIFLNCDREADWEKTKPGTFEIHEVLRSAGITEESEDNYQLSGSYETARFTEDQFIRVKFARIPGETKINGDSFGGCGFRCLSISGRDQNLCEFKANGGVTLMKFVSDKSNSYENWARVIEGKSPGIPKMEEFVEIGKKYRCF